MTTESKCFEAADAIRNGADEIDMVINIGFLLQEKYSMVRDEIQAIKEACGKTTLKVIVETGYLSENEIGIVTTLVD
jgi:deoxyribose-phosphate aldolase